MAVKKSIVALVVGALLSAGAAKAQEPRSVGVDEAALYARFLKAEISATDRALSDVIWWNKVGGGEQRCVKETDEIRARINKAAYYHFEIREVYSPRDVAEQARVGLFQIRVAGAMLAECGGPNAWERLAGYTRVNFDFDFGQADTLTYWINHRNENRAYEERKKAAERAARQVEGQ